MQRVTPVDAVIANLNDGVSSDAVTGLAAVLAQMESQLYIPMVTLTITSSLSGFQRSMAFQNSVWSGHHLTHHFFDERGPHQN